jgi:uncharacterized protein YmfQ (DUF2313 family)
MNIPALLEALAVEPTRVYERVVDLLVEAFPGTTVELIGEWEEALGLPDDCVAPTEYADRIAAIVARFVGTSGHNEADYRELAESLGFPGALVTFTRLSAFRAGDYAGDYLDNEVQWTATIEVVGTGDPVREALLECAFNARRRAHTQFEFVFNDGVVTYDGDVITYGGEIVTYGA